MILAITYLIVGLVLLVFAADWLVKGAANIASALGISPLVVGLTVVAFGTSAPELAVSVMSAFRGQADLAVGNVVGSNIFNILVILGISALIIPLVVHAQLIRFDVPVMIFLSLLLFGLSFDGTISRIDGFILFAMALAYVGFLLRQSRKEKDAGVLSEYEEEYGKKGEDPAWAKNTALVVLGIAGLVLGSDRLVFGAVFIARHFGVSELIIGLTIISVGTSLPEVATSVVAALKGERDIAVGNVVGSNIFNIVTVLGISSIVAPAGIAVARQAIEFDMLFMIAIALAALPVFFHGYRIGRMSGFFFLAFYGAYLAYLILGATGHPAFPGFRHAMLVFVAPATGLALVVMLIRAIGQPKNPA
ncbi:calcium/sodium antiporter [Akkermansiaceae bacterium]|nr:calcium/sodium antiporter [Akkermansiaceae bacterium]